MKRLPLYEEPPQAAVMLTKPEDIDKSCTRCALHEKARAQCISPEGDPGGVLLVADFPTKVEDATGRPFSGMAGKYVRATVRTLGWKGAIAYDHAVRCSPGTIEVKSKHINACRSYGSKVLRDARPSRIICFGGAAMEAIMGRRAPAPSIRRSHGWLFDEDGEPIPVFFLTRPDLALRNRFTREVFEGDLKWALTVNDLVPDFGGETNLVVTEADARTAYRALEEKKWIAYDVETYGRMHCKDFRIESLTVQGHDDEDLYTWTREALKNDGARKWLRRLLEKVPVGVQNGKYDDHAVLLDLKCEVAPTHLDTRLVRKLIDPEAGAKLEYLAYLVGMGGHKDEAEDALADIERELMYQALPPSGLTPTGKVRKLRPPKFAVPVSCLSQIALGIDTRAFSFGFLPDEILYRYNARDVKSTRNLVLRMEPEIKADKQLYRVWTDVVAPANNAIKHIESWGFPIDRAAVRAFAAYCKQKIKDGETKLFAYAPGINYRSPQQLAAFLFGKLKLPVVELTDSGAQSTNKAVLEELSGKHPAVDAILQIRKYDKLDTFYATGMLPHIRDDGRVHSSFLLDGAGSGRMSSQDPNMQNLPRAKGSADAMMARDCFIAIMGYKLLELDFSQLELRIAADLSGDPVMIADFANGIDIHTNAARECAPFVWNISHAKWDSMTPDERDPYRSRIKAAVFGKLYGKTEKGLAVQLNCTVQEVQQINKVIWGRYRVLDRWTKQVISETRKTGYAQTWFGGDWARRRPLHKIADADNMIRAHGENAAVNTPVQGSAADHCTASLYPLVRWIHEDAVDAQVTGTVHDSILIMVRENQLEEVARSASAIMASHPTKNGVKIVVDLKVGDSYGSMKSYHLPN